MKKPLDRCTVHAATSINDTDPAAGIGVSSPAASTEAGRYLRGRLRTSEGIATYRKRSHIAETPFGHAKHNLGFRRFASRGLAWARSEWDFHAAVHNIAKIVSHLAGAPLPA